MGGWGECFVCFSHFLWILFNSHLLGVSSDDSHDNTWPFLFACINRLNHLCLLDTIDSLDVVWFHVSLSWHVCILYNIIYTFSLNINIHIQPLLSYPYKNFSLPFTFVRFHSLSFAFIRFRYLPFSCKSIKSVSPILPIPGDVELHPISWTRNHSCFSYLSWLYPVTLRLGWNNKRPKKAEKVEVI